MSNAQTENNAAQTNYSNAVAKQSATNAAFKTAQSRFDASSKKLADSKAKNTELKSEFDNLTEVRKAQEQKVEAAKNAKVAASQVDKMSKALEAPKQKLDQKNSNP